MTKIDADMAASRCETCGLPLLGTRACGACAKEKCGSGRPCECGRAPVETDVRAGWRYRSDLGMYDVLCGECASERENLQ